MLNVITASALLFGASAMASYEVIYTSGYATTTVYCSEGEKPTTPAGYYAHATHTSPVYYSSATPVYHTKPVYYSSAAPVYHSKPVYSAPVYYSAPAKPYSAPAKPVYSTSCTEEVYSAGYTAPAVYSAPVYSAPVYSAPVYSAPVYSAPVYSAPSNGSYYNAPAPVYSAPVYTTAVVTVCPGVNYCYATTTSYCPESTTAVYTAPAVVYTAPVYTAPAVVYTTPVAVYTAPVYTAPAPVYTAPAAPYTPVSNATVPTPYAYTGGASTMTVSSAMVAIAAVAGLMIAF